MAHERAHDHTMLYLRLYVQKKIQKLAGRGHATSTYSAGGVIYYNMADPSAKFIRN